MGFTCYVAIGCCIIAMIFAFITLISGNAIEAIFYCVFAVLCISVAILFFLSDIYNLLRDRKRIK